MSLSEIRRQFIELSSKKDSLQKRSESLKLELDSLTSKEDVLLQAATAFRHLLDKEVTEAVKSLETFLTEGLRAVFDDLDISVFANVEISRGKVSVSLTTKQVKDGVVLEGDSLDSFGGSVLTIQSILLRVFIILKRNLRPVLFLDESLPALDPAYVSNMASFLNTLADRLGLDILVITHSPALFDASKHAYRISRVGDHASLELVR